MPQLPNTVDLTNVTPSTPRLDGPIPPAWYKASISKSEVEATRAGDPSLRIFFRLQEGSAAGMEIRHMLNLWHAKSETARAISASELAAIAKAVGIQGSVANSDVLHGREIDVKVGPQKDEPRYSEIKGFAAVGTESATEANQLAQRTPVVNPATAVHAAIQQSTQSALAPPPAPPATAPVAAAPAADVPQQAPAPPPPAAPGWASPPL